MGFEGVLILLFIVDLFKKLIDDAILTYRDRGGNATLYRLANHLPQLQKMVYEREDRNDVHRHQQGSRDQRDPRNIRDGLLMRIMVNAKEMNAVKRTE